MRPNTPQTVIERIGEAGRHAAPPATDAEPEPAATVRYRASLREVLDHLRAPADDADNRETAALVVHWG